MKLASSFSEKMPPIGSNYQSKVSSEVALTWTGRNVFFTQALSCDNLEVTKDNCKLLCSLVQCEINLEIIKVLTFLRSCTQDKDFEKPNFLCKRAFNYKQSISWPMILYLLHEKYSEKWELYMILLLFSLYVNSKIN